MTDESGDDVLKGFERVLEKLFDIAEEFDKHRHEINRLIKLESSELTRVLNCHLVLEFMIDKVLEANIPEYNKSKQEKLNFSTKVRLLPVKGKIYAIFIPGILELNHLRNKFAHNLDVKIENSDLKKISRYLPAIKKALNKHNLTRIEIVEGFSKLCAFYFIFYSKELREKYNILASEIKVMDDLSKNMPQDDDIDLPE